MKCKCMFIPIVRRAAGWGGGRQAQAVDQVLPNGGAKEQRLLGREGHIHIK